MVRRPNPPDTVIDTGNRLLHLLRLLSICQLELVGLLKYLPRLKISDAGGLLSLIDIVSPNQRVLIRPR